MNVGRVLITPDTKVGDILATGKFDISRDNNISCSGNSTLYGRILQGGPSSISDKIWTTNVPGWGCGCIARSARRKVPIIRTRSIVVAGCIWLRGILWLR